MRLQSSLLHIALTVVLAGCTRGSAAESSVPRALLKATEQVHQAADLPIVQTKRGAGDAMMGVVASPEAALKSYLNKHGKEVSRTAAELAALSHAETRWSDDASVVLGFLYSYLGADPLWATEDAERQYRRLAEWKGQFHLEPWTRERLKSVPGIGYGWSDGASQASSDTTHIVEYFARQLVARILVRDGRQTANATLDELRHSGNLSNEVSDSLDRMIQGYPK